MSELADEYEALIQFLYLAPIGLAQLAPDGAIAMINPVSAQLLMPLSRDGSLDNLFTALEGVAPELRHLVAGFADPHGMICDGLRIQLGAGERGKSDPQMLSLSLLKLDATRVMAVLRDVTLEVRRERLLRQSEAWLDAIYSEIKDYALVSLDRAGRVGAWNESIGRVTGFAADAVLGEPYSIFYPEGATTPERVIDRLREADASGWSLDDGWRRRADGSRFWGSALLAPLRGRNDPGGPDTSFPGGDDEPAYCLVIRDISDRREASENHRRAQSCDHLTGLANRRAFFEAAELEIERRRIAPRPLSMILFDADQFKKINDTHGHPAGDAVLRHLAAMLCANFRQVDLVARIGGEEFAVLLPSTDLAGAMAVADRLRLAVAAQPAVIDEIPIHYTVSAGVATMGDDVAGLDALIKRADDALYTAKASGRNRIESRSSRAMQPPRGPDGEPV